MSLYWGFCINPKSSVCAGLRCSGLKRGGDGKREGGREKLAATISTAGTEDDHKELSSTGLTGDYAVP